LGSCVRSDGVLWFREGTGCVVHRFTGIRGLEFVGYGCCDFLKELTVWNEEHFENKSSDEP
jgi:hypothetical protein